MSALLLLTGSLQPSVEVLPALSLLPHQVRVLPAEASALLEAPDADLLLVDGRADLAHARDLCRLIRATGTDVPVLLLIGEGGLSVVNADWGFDDVLLASCGPGEVDARIRIALARAGAGKDPDDLDSKVIRSGEVTVDETTYTARLGKRQLDLTFKEFELLKFLAQHPGRVFTRQQLLQEVWGYDYFGGTRTVDVHVRRLRAKLGPENEQLIGTVRNVGYRFVASGSASADRARRDADTLDGGAGADSGSGSASGSGSDRDADSDADSDPGAGASHPATAASGLSSRVLSGRGLRGAASAESASSVGADDVGAAGVRPAHEVAHARAHGEPQARAHVALADAVDGAAPDHHAVAQPPVGERDVGPIVAVTSCRASSAVAVPPALTPVVRREP